MIGLQIIERELRNILEYWSYWNSNHFFPHKIVAMIAVLMCLFKSVLFALSKSQLIRFVFDNKTNSANSKEFSSDKLFIQSCLVNFSPFFAMHMYEAHTLMNMVWGQNGGKTFTHMHNRPLSHLLNHIEQRKIKKDEMRFRYNQIRFLLCVPLPVFLLFRERVFCAFGVWGFF